jgi:AraC family transcriptional regulator
MSSFAVEPSDRVPPLSRSPQATNTAPFLLPGSSGIEPRWPVAYSPSDIVECRSASWTGVVVESIQLMRLAPFECRFNGPCHLLLAAELAERDLGETFVEGLPPSSLRKFTHKLTFVPAGHDFHESQSPCALTRTVCVYIDPRGPLVDPELQFEKIQFKPRLFFHDRELWEIALKLKSQAHSSGLMHRQYGEAMGIMLLHELARINGTGFARTPTSRSGLARWQQRRVAAYIEEHVAEDIALATLAGLVGLSPYHFCRAFKQSFGIPPRKYHACRRIEQAKQLLARRELSITAIALALGFSDTSAFSAAFHRLSGQTPSRYRHTLD